MALAKHVIGGCWIAFVLYWALNARSLKPSAEGQSWLGILLHRTPTLLGGLLLLWPCLRPPLELNLFPRTSAAGWLGVALCALGLLAAIWSRQTLGANWSSIVVFRAGHELVQTGPYRFVRHPIYSSVLLMCLGSAVAIDRLGSWLGLPLLFAGFWIKLRQEEALLTRHFPVEYPAYQARAKALIPRLL